MTVVCDQKQFPFLFTAFDLIQHDEVQPGIWEIHDLPSDNVTVYQGALGIVPIRNTARFKEVITEQLKDLVEVGCERFLIWLLDCVDLPLNLKQLQKDAKSAIGEDGNPFIIASTDSLAEAFQSFLPINP